MAALSISRPRSSATETGRWSRCFRAAMAWLGSIRCASFLPRSTPLPPPSRLRIRNLTAHRSADLAFNTCRRLYHAHGPRGWLDWVVVGFVLYACGALFLLARRAARGRKPPTDSSLARVRFAVAAVPCLVGLGAWSIGGDQWCAVVALLASGALLLAAARVTASHGATRAYLPDCLRGAALVASLVRRGGSLTACRRVRDWLSNEVPSSPDLPGCGSKEVRRTGLLNQECRSR